MIFFTYISQLRQTVQMISFPVMLAMALEVGLISLCCTLGGGAPQVFTGPWRWILYVNDLGCILIGSLKWSLRSNVAWRQRASRSFVWQRRKNPPVFCPLGVSHHPTLPSSESLQSKVWGVLHHLDLKQSATVLISTAIIDSLSSPKGIHMSLFDTYRSQQDKNCHI